MRRFTVLLSGLSAESRLAGLARNDGGPVHYATPEEGLAIFDAIGR